MGDKGKNDDKRTILLMKDYPELAHFVPVWKNGPKAGELNWAGIKSQVTKKKKD